MYHPGAGVDGAEGDRAASKGAIISMTYIAAVQLASHDINVNAICPGLVDTQMLRGMLAQRSADTGTPVEQLVEGTDGSAWSPG